MEKLVGASSLAVGELAAAAFAFINPSVTTDSILAPVVPKESAGRILETVTSSAHSTSNWRSMLSENIDASSRLTSEMQSITTTKMSPSSALPKPTSSGLIRPLTMAPGKQVEAEKYGRLLQPMKSTPIMAGAPADSAVSSLAASTPNRVYSAPAPVTTDTSSQDSTVAVALGGEIAAVSSQPPVFSNNAPAGLVRSSATEGSRPNSIVNPGTSRVQPRIQNIDSGSQTGGIPLANGYIATGGLYHRDTIAQPISNFRVENQLGGGTGSFTGTGSGSGTGTGTGMTSGSQTSTTGVTDSGGNYSISGTSAGPATGDLIIMNSGNNVTGGAVSFDLSGGGSASLSNITWSASGAPVLVSNESVPDPSLGQTNFVETPYDISSQTGDSINFLWGPTPGAETLTATATLTLNGRSTTVSTAAKVKVGVVNWKVDLKYLTYASVIQSPTLGAGRLTYSEHYFHPPGIEWFASTTALGHVDIIQTVEGGNVTATSPTGPTRHGLMDTSTVPATPAPFPLLDIGASKTNPFYGSPSGGVGSGSDSPTWSMNTGETLTMALQFKDWVMYLDSGATEWVPIGSFQWNINFTATPTWTGNWTPTGSVVVTKPIASGSYPTWSDYAYKYLNYA